jgi:hypothetical protein
MFQAPLCYPKKRIDRIDTVGMFRLIERHTLGRTLTFCE